MKRILFISLLGLTALILSCSKKDNPIPIKKEDVYVGGNVKINGTWYPAYWKNGKQTILDNQVGGYVGSIKVVANGADTTVYAAGNQGNKIVLWKNGVPTDITTGIKFSWVNSITVDGLYVYLIGYEFNANNVQTAKIWKNTIATELGDGINPSYGYSIQSNNGNIYALYRDNGVLKLSKDGTASSMPQFTGAYGFSDEILIDGNNEYICGYIADGVHPINPITVKNGVVTNLQVPSGILNGGAVSMALAGKDSYVTGYYANANNKYLACYWKNGERNDLSDGLHDGYAYGIAIANGHVYITSDYYFNDSSWKSYLWKDGVAVAPFDGTNDIYAIAICVLTN